MKSILFVIPQLSNGGAERVVINVANGIVSKGENVGILTYEPEGDYKNQVDSRVKLHSLNRKVKTINEKLATIKDIVAISYGYDVVVSSLELFTDDMVYLCKLCNDILKRPKKYYAMVHIALSNYPRFTNKKRHRNQLRFLYEKFNGVIAVSDGVKNDIIQTLGITSQRITVIYNPVAVDYIVAKKDEPVDVTPYTPYFINMGRLNQQKDQETLIKAFKLFLDQVKSEFHLLILGRGPLEEDLQQLVCELDLQNNVHFCGFQSNPWKFIAHSMGLVSTSIFEGFSLVIAEAMACRIPVIATDCPYGPAELIKSNQNGYLVKMKNINQITEALQKVVNNHEEVQEKVANAFSYIIREFDSPTITDRYLNFFN
jgi:glycosyltransferase involved in cell wall biosynthesis